MNARLKLILFAAANLGGALCAGLVLLGLHASADQNAATDDVPRLIPYHGTMTFNGAPVEATGDGARWLRFDLWDGGTSVYSQSVQVDVRDGRFTALLGPTDDAAVAIQDVIRNADALDVEITLLNDPMNDADDIPMSNRQRLTITPLSVWATHGVRFQVARDLTVARDLMATGGLRVRSVEGLLSMNPSGMPVMTGTGGFSVADDLSVGGNTTLGNAATDSTVVSGDITAQRTFLPRTLTVGRDLTLGGRLLAGHSNMTDVNAATGGTVTIGQTLRVVEGQTQISPGATHGLFFPDIIGNSGDTAWIRYLGDGSASELQFGVGNDADDDIEIHAAGAVELEINDVYGLKTTGDLQITGTLTGGNLACHADACDGYVDLPDGGSTGGVWQSIRYCPANTYACGLAQKIDNDGDHEGVTLLRFYCCPF